jgi:plastocyanin
MNKNTTIILAIVALVLVVGGGWYYKSMSMGMDSMTPTGGSGTTSSTPTPDTSMGATDSAMMGTTKEFTVTGSAYKFDPATITVNKGDKVKIIFKSSGGMHDLVIDELNVKTAVLPSGKEETIEFTADKAGSFKYYCAVGNHRAMGMEGTLVVK